MSHQFDILLINQINKMEQEQEHKPLFEIYGRYYILGLIIFPSIDALNCIKLLESLTSNSKRHQLCTEKLSA